MIQDHEDSYCRKAHHWTLGPTCQWCTGAPPTTRFSPKVEAQRCDLYRRLRARGVAHRDALGLLDQVAVLARTSRAENVRDVGELVVAGRDRVPLAELVRPIFAPVPVAVAA